MKKILSLSLICSIFLLLGQVNFASFNQDQDQEPEMVEATESEPMQEVEQSVAEEPQAVGFTQELKNRFIEGENQIIKILFSNAECMIKKSLT